MAEVISRLNELFEEIPEEIRYTILDIFCKAVGLRGGPVEAVSFQMLKSKIQHLVSELGLHEFLLIPGLLHSAIDSFEYQAYELERLVETDAASTIEILRGIDDDLPESLKQHLTKERLLEMQNGINEFLLNAPELIAEYRRTASLIQTLKQKHFPLDVWRASIHRLLD